MLILYRKTCHMPKGLNNRLQSFLSIQYLHGDLCKHLGIDSSTDHPDWYSNLFLNAYINRHVHVEYLKMILFYSPLGMIWHVFPYSINTNIYHFRSMKYRQYIYQCENGNLAFVLQMNSTEQSL